MDAPAGRSIELLDAPEPQSDNRKLRFAQNEAPRSPGPRHGERKPGFIQLEDWNSSHEKRYSRRGGEREVDASWPSENLALGTLITVCSICILLVWLAVGLVPIHVLSHRR